MSPADTMTYARPAPVMTPEGLRLDSMPAYRCCALTFFQAPQAMYHRWRVHGETTAQAWATVEAAREAAREGRPDALGSLRSLQEATCEDQDAGPQDSAIRHAGGKNEPVWTGGKHPGRLPDRSTSSTSAPSATTPGDGKTTPETARVFDQEAVWTGGAVPGHLPGQSDRQRAAVEASLARFKARLEEA